MPGHLHLHRLAGEEGHVLTDQPDHRDIVAQAVVPHHCGGPLRGCSQMYLAGLIGAEGHTPYLSIKSAVLHVLRWTYTGSELMAQSGVPTASRARLVSAIIRADPAIWIWRSAHAPKLATTAPRLPIRSEEHTSE